MFRILVESRSNSHCFFSCIASDVSELRSRLSDVLNVFNLQDVKVNFYWSPSPVNKSKSDSK